MKRRDFFKTVGLIAGAVFAARTHNPGIAGSIPAPAPKTMFPVNVQLIEPVHIKFGVFDSGREIISINMKTGKKYIYPYLVDPDAWHLIEPGPSTPRTRSPAA